MITKIFNKYYGSHDFWYPEVKEINIYVNPEIKAKYSEGCYEKENALLTKWKPYIAKGWYGFSLGEPCPADWYSIIDEFLTYLVGLQEKGKISRFEIHQIKTKWGGLRFYVGYSCEDEELIEHIELQINTLESTLFDRKLIY